MLISAYFASLSPLALFRALPGSIAQGLIWGLLALGVYITYKLLDFADLSVDGSFATGGAVAVMLIRSDMNPWISLIFAFGVCSEPDYRQCKSGSRSAFCDVSGRLFLVFESGQNRKKRGRTRKSRRTFSAAWIGSVIYAKNAFAALSRYSVSLTPAVSYGECIAS